MFASCEKKSDSVGNLTLYVVISVKVQVCSFFVGICYFVVISGILPTLFVVFLIE
jgi:hypothetical protein